MRHKCFTKCTNTTPGKIAKCTNSRQNAQNAQISGKMQKITGKIPKCTNTRQNAQNTQNAQIPGRSSEIKHISSICKERICIFRYSTWCSMIMSIVYIAIINTIMYSFQNIARNYCWKSGEKKLLFKICSWEIIENLIAKNIVEIWLWKKSGCK